MTDTDNKTINFMLLCVARWSHVNLNITILFLQSAAERVKHIHLKVILF